MSLKIKSLIVLFILFASCNTNKVEKIIVLSTDSHKKHVTKWISNYDTTTQIIILYDLPKDSINYYLSVASGVIITGGEDVNPNLFGKDSLRNMCGTINPYRDSLEIKMINYALINKIPIFGICRGLQIMNVSQGGSLIIDIPTFIGDSLHRKSTGRTNHKVLIMPNSRVSLFVKADSGQVLSNHHQAIDDLAEIFNIAALAPDSVIEAIEIKDSTKYNFAVGVQWHPEGMDFNDKLSKNFALEFLTHVNKFYNQNVLN